MSILNQPFQGQLGNILIDKIENYDYSNLTIFSAFAKNSGVLRLKPSLEKFKENSGHIKAFIGIDLDGTSYESLLNLFSLCDELYVVHSENPSVTYHSKIYLLENDTHTWCAIGSNNLTGGGLWTNIECASILEYSLSTQKGDLDNIYSVMEKYSDNSYVCSTKIESIDDINTLLDSNYISKEISQKISTIKKEKKEKEKKRENRLFGSEKVSIPTIEITSKTKEMLSKKTVNTQTNIESIDNSLAITSAFTNELFWFEMRKSTGGSRNILDLSKLGQIVEGSVKGTPYEYKDSHHMYGGIKFFEIDPEDTTKEKDITINYLGKDYFPSTIKFAPNNGSWRIQLKGNPKDGSDELSKFGNRGDFVSKILIFEKINSDYYVLSLIDDSNLETIKSLSRVWARNGSNATSKAYGML